MSIETRFQEYADAFEESFIDDDWSRIEPYFTDDVVHEGDPDVRDRTALLARFKVAVDRFDRRMDARFWDRQDLSAEGDTVQFTWAITFRLAGAPDLTISGLQIAVFEGDRIARLGGGMDPEAERAMAEWMAAHGARLQG